MLATFVSEEVQLTEFVRFCVLPSLYVPVAVYCCVVPRAIDAPAGFSAIEINDGVTVRLVEPEIDPELPLIVVVPAAMLLASPFEPVVLLMVAALVLLELQVTDCVKSYVYPLKVPIAVNC